MIRWRRKLSPSKQAIEEGKGMVEQITLVKPQMLNVELIHQERGRKPRVLSSALVVPGKLPPDGNTACAYANTDHLFMVRITEVPR